MLRGERIAHHLAAFTKEYAPVGPTETAIVNDLARQAADIELWGEAVAAVQRQVARGLPRFALPQVADSEAYHDAVLAGTMAAESVHRSERLRLGHSRAFYRAQQRLEQRQARRQQLASEDDAATLPPAFDSEAACEAYLADRFRSGAKRCHHCGGREGYVIARRRCWECGSCKAQTGLRAGTVMARSPIPLRQWFAAIRWLLCRPTIRADELAEKLKIRRLTTVRSMAKKIRAAMTAEDGSEQLAGLDSYIGTGGHLT
jgi:hypothetical protein